MSQPPMIEVLKADKPLDELAEKLRLFGQFVGSWEAQVINYNGGGTSRTIEAEWHFGWVLEGRAIQGPIKGKAILFIARQINDEIVLG